MLTVIIDRSYVHMSLSYSIFLSCSVQCIKLVLFTTTFPSHSVIHEIGCTQTKKNGENQARAILV